ncbi:MAG: hypothetical protein PUA56_01215 [Bacillales bacterium]|nr:hypothetical protein [Bacillales bacterium]
MRNIEKGLLLAEMFSANTDSHIGPFIEWIKLTPQYQLFEERKKKLQYKSSRSARRIYSYFKRINIEKVSSIQDGMIVYGKINYLLRISDPQCYTNPLLIAYIEDKNMTIGDLKVEFDNKLITLNELSKLKGFSLELKEEALRRVLEKWEYELHLQVLNPVNEIETRKQYIPIRHIFTPFRIFELIYCLLFTIIICSMYFAKSDFLMGITHYGNSNIVINLTYSLVFSFTLLLDLVVFSIFFIKGKEYMFYIKQRKIVFQKIRPHSIKVFMELNSYLHSKVANMESLDEKLTSFNSISKYYSTIEYFQNRLAKKTSIKKDTISIVEKTFLLLQFLVVIVFIVMIIMKIGGNL